MAQRAPVPPHAQAVFLATAVAAVAVVASGHRAIPDADAWAWWLVALTVPVLYRFPVAITRDTRTIEFGFESVVVIFLSFATPDYALVLWTGGWLLAQVPIPWAQAVRRTSPWISLYNTAMTTLSGAAVVLVVTRLVPNALGTGLWALLAVLLGAAAYFSVDYVLSAIAMPLLGRSSLREAWLYDDFGVALASTGGVAVLGYLGAVAMRADPWAVPLIAVPVATFVMASRGFSRASMEHGRVEVLLSLATRLQQATTEQQVLEVVLDEGPAALRTEALLLTTTAPAATGIHSAVAGGPAQRWLVAATRRSHLPYSMEDRRTLDLLASMTADTLDRLSMHAELERLAAQDPLTGLSNRATLQRALESALAQRDQPSTAVLFCDLDGFKHVNDQHGHETGDQVLRLVAERMRTCVREGDLVARMGGDEFVALLPRADREEASVVARRITLAMSQPTPVAATDITIGVSIGVAVSTAGTSAEELLRQADTAMYEAKSSGTNQMRTVDVPVDAILP